MGFFVGEKKKTHLKFVHVIKGFCAQLLVGLNFCGKISMLGKVIGLRPLPKVALHSTTPLTLFLVMLLNLTLNGT
jgi:hypothetical protein